MLHLYIKCILIHIAFPYNQRFNTTYLVFRHISLSVTKASLSYKYCLQNYLYVLIEGLLIRLTCLDRSSQGLSEKLISVLYNLNVHSRFYGRKPENHCKWLVSWTIDQTSDCLSLPEVSRARSSILTYFSVSFTC